MKKGVSEAEARPILEKLVSAIEVMHHQGVVHRDWNPQNVFLVNLNAEDSLSDVRIKIIDFNISKMVPKESFNMFSGSNWVGKS